MLAQQELAVRTIWWDDLSMTSDNSGRELSKDMYVILFGLHWLNLATLATVNQCSHEWDQSHSQTSPWQHPVHPTANPWSISGDVDLIVETTIKALWYTG